jgi:uncharacterized membrane protein YqgA involved in biofilm formation
MSEGLKLGWKHKAVVLLPAVLGTVVGRILVIGGALKTTGKPFENAIAWGVILAGDVLLLGGFRISDKWMTNLQEDERVVW